MRIAQNTKSLLVWSLFSLVLCGCGDSSVGGREVVDVSGNVQFAGEPINTGTILFESDDNEHRGYSAPIKDGTYTAQVQPGAMKVKITATKEIPGKFEEIPGPEGEEPKKWPATEMYIPVKYNSESTLRYTVPAEGASDANFELTP